jgi:2-hydroxy-3-keto-5-methylthiopentenyl-1-phosphate phosphatase
MRIARGTATVADGSLRPVENLLIACDFDGTITERDTLHLIVERFGERGLWDTIAPRLRAGELTVEQAMQLEFDSVRATRDEVVGMLLAEAGLRAGFRELVDWAAARGHRLAVLSSGFRTVIDPLLAHWGLAHLDVESNDARFAVEGCTLLWAPRGGRCDLCGRPCKRHGLRARAGSSRVVYVGDGISDRCVSGIADLVFARADLARFLADDGVTFLPFENFVEVRERLEAPSTLAA